MNLRWLIFSLVICGTLEVQAQSFWLRKSLYSNSGSYVVAASDTANYIFATGEFNPLITDDYGKTWNAVFRQDPRITYAVTDLVHLTPTRIILGCNFQYSTLYHKEGKPEYDVGHIVRSTDGGKTWTDISLGVRDTSVTEFQAKLRVTSPIGAIEALDSNHILIATMTTHYLHSSDGGETWDTIPSPISEHWQGHYMMGNVIVNPIVAYPAPNTLVVAELDSAFPLANYVHKIYRTTDLGKSWNLGFQMTKPIADVAFIDSNIGFAAGNLFDHDSYNSTVIIDKTTDGGRTWFNIYAQRFPMSARLRSIAFTDSLYGLAAGDSGLLLCTTDGGKTWDPMTTDISIGDSMLVLGKIAYPSRTKAMIAASTGEVFIYQPDTLLDMPDITTPMYGQVFSKEIMVRWNPVAGATRYHVVIRRYQALQPIADTVVEDTYFLYRDSVQRQDEFYVTALNDTKTSNAAHRTLRLIPSAAVDTQPRSSTDLALMLSSATGEGRVRITASGLHSVRDKQHMDLRLYDMLGREQMNLSSYIRGRQEASVTFTIPLSSLQTGVYVAVLRTSHGAVSGKVVLER